MISATIQEYADSLGVADDTLRRKFARAGKTLERKQQVPLADLFAVLIGDYDSQKERKVRAEADLLELEIKEKEGQLFSAELVQARIDKALGLVRQAILGGRAEIPNRANPQDPKTAKIAWDQWEQRFFPSIREGMKTNDETIQ